MQVTIDSNEQLDRVLRVVGSLYGVELVVAGGAARPRRASTRAARTRRAKKAAPARAAKKAAAPGTAKKATAPKAAKKAAPARRRAKKATRAVSRPRRAARPGASTLDTPSVRVWARANGHQVSDRGRLSDSIIAEYRKASAES
jgi:hypothetical protein